MSLTKKHFIKIAEILNFRRNLHLNNNPNKVLMVENIADDFIKWFKLENPLFDEVKFKEAVLK